MIRRVLLILLMLVTVLSGAFAGSLLRRSIESSTHEELVAMCMAYGLDSSGSDSALVGLLLKYFGITGEDADDDTGTGTSTGGKPATSIAIRHSDELFSNNNVIILSGNVELSFTTDDGTRSLVADTVTVDLDSKILEATGSVELGGSTKKDRVFSGSVVSLDWSTLDVIVYEGTSSTTRKNSSGTKIEFYVSGKTVSYAGTTSGIIFNNGTIATTDEDPYWSISAGKLSLSETDLFVDRAVFRLGRVPVFYFPIFFYPGTTLSFNPAIGLSSDKGSFLTTTYEVYGNYPKLGVLGTKKSKSSGSSSASEDDPDYTGAITAFLNTDDDTEMIRDGFYYRPLQAGEDLGELQTWARKTGSYLAVFVDAYEKMGIVAGFDTLNSLFDKKMKITATGAVGYMANPEKTRPRFRYTLDFNFNFKKNSFTVDLKMPVLSDPYVRTDYLNRNTGFAIDALLGSEQYFPSGYSTVNKYTWVVNASYSKKIGNYSFNLSSIKADIDFEINSTEKDEEGRTIYRKKAVEASLPYLSFSSDGTFLSLQGQSQKTTRTIDYTNPLAKELAAEMQELQESGTTGTVGDTGVSMFRTYSGPALTLEETTVSEAGSLKLGYSYNQTLDNIYKKELVHDSFYTKGKGSVYVSAAMPGKWFSLTETIKPDFNFSRAENGTKVDEFYLTSDLKASIPKFGITYTLTQKIFNHYVKETPSTSETTDRWGEWNKADVTAHNINFSQKVGSFTLGFYFQLKPLTETIKPSVSYSRNGFSASADFSMKRPPEQEKFTKDALNVNLSYTSGLLTASLANKYDFSKVSNVGADKWKGFSIVEKLTVKPMEGLTLSVNSTFTGKFELSKLQFSVGYKLDTSVLDLSTNASMSFKDKDFKREALGLNVKLSQDKITVWKGRIGFEQTLNMSFTYDFENPYRTSFTIDFTVGFAIAEFLDLSISVSSANKTFARYYENGSFSFAGMWEDLWRSFDFFGDGRKNTGFNLNSFKVSLVHYMRDWDLHVEAQGSMSTKYSNKYEWVPTVTVYIKWNAIPELKTEGNWDSKSDEWT